MKVFISWSGERSKLFANALHEWLPMVLQSVAPWLSHADIAAGDRWADTVAKELEANDFGITCVTPENMSSLWIHFEAGALAKRMEEGRVIPLLLDIEFKDMSGPLTQFQAKKVDRDGLLDVVSAINKLSGVKVSDAQLPKQFDALWPKLETQISEIRKTQLPVKQQRPQQEILEELVWSIRGLDVRFREIIEEPPGMRRRRPRAPQLMMRELVDVSRDMKRRPNDPLGLLIMMSALREDFPWLYEIAVDAYHETVRRTPRARDARQRLLQALAMLQHGPLAGLTTDNKEMLFMLREISREAGFVNDDRYDSESEDAASKEASPNFPSAN